ncbi:arsenate reductase ArsC [Roseibacillus ishigakijimensis]|uniref:Arsenate reductase ArsC n=1 Tax=Roseibacillus ishigakijimensis TaxID=454146 RepID=A0A934VNU5_9BACT|nr:arsenate reductase ArsC [Roseibacillus ishigakijimensis]MBK1835426.1 arsenate reductase ArsC [Roseibacillus ishigakijimensis]
MKKVLFVCVHNSARSQMAEAFLNQACPQDFLAESAGLEPGTLNPLVVKAMAEVGIDLTGQSTDSVFELFKAGRLYSHVITVCDGANAERCPIFPGLTQREAWSFPDPAALEGSEEEKMAEVRKIRDAIRKQVETWCASHCALSPAA